MFRDVAHFLKSGPVSQGFPSRYRHGVVTIGKSVDIMVILFRKLSFDGLGAPLQDGGEGCEALSSRFYIDFIHRTSSEVMIVTTS